MTARLPAQCLRWSSLCKALSEGCHCCLPILMSFASPRLMQVSALACAGGYGMSHTARSSNLLNTFQSSWNVSCLVQMRTDFVLYEWPRFVPMPRVMPNYAFPTVSRVSTLSLCWPSCRIEVWVSRLKPITAWTVTRFQKECIGWPLSAHVFYEILCL